jgi:4a-hydroxytetrahydrobiopterin dehydratase
LTADDARKLLAQVAGHWQLAADGRSIQAHFAFRNYYQTTAFVNAVAWIAHHEDHHPDISFGYKSANISYSTHAAGGLTENDFICAAKVDALLDSSDSA